MGPNCAFALRYISTEKCHQNGRQNHEDRDATAEAKGRCNIRDNGQSKKTGSLRSAVPDGVTGNALSRFLPSGPPLAPRSSRKPLRTILAAENRCSATFASSLSGTASGGRWAASSLRPRSLRSPSRLAFFSQVRPLRRFPRKPQENSTRKRKNFAKNFVGPTTLRTAILYTVGGCSVRPLKSFPRCSRVDPKYCTK